MPSADSLDNVIGRGLAANKPTAPLAQGYIYYSTDTDVLERYSGSAWESFSPAGGGSSNWWDLPSALIVGWAVFSSGQIANTFGYKVPALLSGTVDNAGTTGAGGFTELTVPCSTFYDLTPANNSPRGIWGGTSSGLRADMGMYFRASARFPQASDCALQVGLLSANPVLAPVTATAMFIKRSGDANWWARSADGATAEETDTGVAWATDDWHNFEVYVFNDGGTMTVLFWIDGVLVATHTTNVPSASTVLLRTYVECLWTSADTATNDSVLFCSETFWALKGAANDLGYAAL